MSLIRVLSPIGVETGESIVVPGLPRALTGKTVGFLDNTKHNFDRLVADIGRQLQARHGVAGVVHVRKANASTPAAPELIAELAKTCDVVFAGSAD